MDLDDLELVRRLILRDGPFGAKRFSHRAGGGCRYAAAYEAKGETCPWCAAETRRAEAESASTTKS